MNETERVDKIVRRYIDNPTGITVDMLVNVVFQFDVYDEIENVLAGKPSMFSEAVEDSIREARTFTPSPFAVAIVDSDYN